MAKRISDEIRNWCASHEAALVDGDDCGELRALADRIDAEMVELPQSADGKIWTGRENCFWTGSEDGDWHKFCGLHFADGRWCVEDKDFERYPAASAWYERPDSWERIADDVETLVWFDDEDEERLRHELADRIRKLADKEGQR